MPVKGSTLKYGNRDHIFGKKFFKKLKDKNSKLEFDYGTSSEVIRTANKIISQVVENEDDGFKLPFGLGYLCATKYVPTNAMIDWAGTKKIGKPGKFAYFTNLHTMGFAVKIAWFRVGRITNSTLNETWKFEAMSCLSSAVSAAFDKGKPYKEWKHIDFIEKSRLENLFNKRYRKELKD